MSKKLTSQQKMSIVLNTPELCEKYLQEVSNEGLKYSKSGCKKGGKRIGIQKLVLSQKYIAASIYDNNITEKAITVKNTAKK